MKKLLIFFTVLLFACTKSDLKPPSEENPVYVVFTIEDENPAKIAVQFSTDGKNFTTFQEIPAKGKGDYKAEIKEPAGAIKYRIEVTSETGLIYYSDYRY